MARKSVLLIGPKDERIEKEGIEKILALHPSLMKDFGGEAGQAKRIRLLRISVNDDPVSLLQGTGSAYIDLREMVEGAFRPLNVLPAYAVILGIDELYESGERILVSTPARDAEIEKAETLLTMMMAMYGHRLKPKKDPVVYTAKLIFPNGKRADPHLALVSSSNPETQQVAAA